MKKSRFYILKYAYVIIHRSINLHVLSIAVLSMILLDYYWEERLVVFFLLFKFFLNFIIIFLYCSGFCLHWHESAMDYMCSPSQSPLPPPSPSHPSGSSQCTSPEHLSHASNLGWWSVSPLIVYLFQCYSLRTPHPRLLPQSLKVCSVRLGLFFCFAYRVIITIFLNSIYMH